MTGPVLNFPPQLLLRAQGSSAGMKVAVFDVDGVLTDSRILVGEHGETLKPFSTLDGYGIRLLRRSGIVPVVVTGRDAPALCSQFASLPVPCVNATVNGFKANSKSVTVR